ATATATASASASADADADPISRLSVSVKFAKLERGDTQVATGTGFAPGEVVSGTSGSASLGTQVASAEGTVTFTWAVPTNAELGTHTVTLTAPDSGSASASFQVVADGLAGTGSDVPFGWIALGVLLLMLGLGTALVARSRRVVAAAE
ncbi:MAG TPA: hypothetical protein VN035_13870, partial [Microbacterium sp.]|nr:hypothetical protein [Microbacterium sp.]